MYSYKNIIFNIILFFKLLELATSDCELVDYDDTSETDNDTTTTTIEVGFERDAGDVEWNTTKSTTERDDSGGTKLLEDDETDSMRVICPQFKNASEISVDAMAGAWRSALYRAPHAVPCFKMHIRKLSSEEKTHYSQLYGDFDDRVSWDDCNLEVRPDDERRDERRAERGGGVRRLHFLQGCERGRGVLQNVILELTDNNKTVRLVEESADQWLVASDVLLLKDCASGALVSFWRAPHRRRLLAAAAGFGELAGGEWACAAPPDYHRRRAFHGEFDAFSDVVFFE